MAGGYVSVVARGTQDAYLTSKPQVTNWKAVYKRTTIFATESIEQVFSGSADFGKKATCTFQRQGDLIDKIYVRAVLPVLGEGQCWCPRVGHAMIKNVVLMVGGTVLDTQCGDWMNVEYELSRDLNKAESYERMIGDTAELTVPSGGTPQTTLWIPLRFSNCKEHGLALPFIALQYHDIRVEVEFQPLSKLVCGRNAASATGSLVSCSIYADFVFLGQVERKKFAEATHEYLIEQVQHNGGESVTSQSQKFRVDFNHPCKDFNINVQQTKYISGQKFMAWNPKDVEAMRILATKRIASAWGDLSTNGFFVGGSVADAGLRQAITDAKVGGLDVSGATDINDPDMLVVAGAPLDDRYISMTVHELRALVGSAVDADRPGSGFASASHDVVVNDWTNYGIFLNKRVSPVSQVLIQLNNSDRLSKRESMYFDCVQPWQCYRSAPTAGLLAYSFALDPIAHQPGGTTNMSRIDNAAIHIEFVTRTNVLVNGSWADIEVRPYASAICNIYSKNYNIFRCIGGMGGMGFAN